MELKLSKKLFWTLSGIALFILAVLFFINIGELSAWFSGVTRILRPVIIGLIIAYLCNPLFRVLERKVLIKIKQAGLRRVISLILTYLIAFTLIALLFVLIIPQLIDSVKTFVGNYEYHLNTFIASVNNVIQSINNVLSGMTTAVSLPYLDKQRIYDAVMGLFQSSSFNKESIMKYLTLENILSISNLASSVLSLLTDVIFGIFISVYLLNTKEKRYAQIMRWRKAILPESLNQRITRICTIADTSFGSYLEGQLIDAAIVAVLVYCIISLFRVPYAILIATIIGITNIIPVLGPFIGLVPTSIIILMTDPSKLIPFLLIILVVQQFDGNVLLPKILGDNTGVSSLCIVIAISLMSGLWGIVGTLLSVPLFATILELGREALDKRLIKKGLPLATESYYTGEAPVEDAPKKKRSLFAKPERSIHESPENGKGNLTADELRRLQHFNESLSGHSADSEDESTI